MVELSIITGLGSLHEVNNTSYFTACQQYIGPVGLGRSCSMKTLLLSDCHHSPIFVIESCNEYIRYSARD